MDRPTDIPPLPSRPTDPPRSTAMSTITNRPVPSTSDEPSATSSEARPTDAPTSPAPRPTSSRPQPTSTTLVESSTSDPPPPLPPSTSEPPPPPSSPSSSAERNTEPSAEPTSSLVSSIHASTTLESAPTTTSISPSPTTFTTSPTISSTPSTSATSAAPTIAPMTPSGLSHGAKLGLIIGFSVVGGLALIMGLMSFIHRMVRRKNRVNEKIQQDLEERAQLDALQSRPTQPEPPLVNRRGSAMFGIHPTRFGDVDQESVQHSQQYQPYSRESGYRGW